LIPAVPAAATKPPGIAVRRSTVGRALGTGSRRAERELGVAIAIDAALA
jgi:hypothetical protein